MYTRLNYNVLRSINASHLNLSLGSTFPTSSAQRHTKSKFITKNVLWRFIGTTTNRQGVLPSDNHGDGKTTITILNSDMKEIMMINSYSELGFRLNTTYFVLGPAVLFPKLVLQWNVGNTPESITEESLSLFKALDPPVDILIVGLGNAGVKPNHNLVKYCLKNKINAEFLPTYQACTTFNFLNAEQRYVAAAMIPPSVITHKTSGILAIERSRMLEEDLKFAEVTNPKIKRGLLKPNKKTE